MTELARLIEAVLFAAARPIGVAELAKLCKRSENDILASLAVMKNQLKKENSPTMLIEDEGSWKLTIREKYISVIKKVVTKTELPKSILETLAIVAYKAPVMQSKVVKLRTNKAYDHLSFLERKAFISREKKGRSKLIRLTPKFFEYFSLDPKKLKAKFKKMGDLESAISAKEKEHEEIEKEQRKQAEEIIDAPSIVLRTETYDSVEKINKLESTGVEPYNNKVGELSVYGEPEKESTPLMGVKKKSEPEEPAVKTAEQVEFEQMQEQTNKTKAQEEPEQSREEKIKEEVAEHIKEAKQTEFETEGLYPRGVPKELQSEVDAKVEAILTGKEEETPEKREVNIGGDVKLTPISELTNSPQDEKTEENPLDAPKELVDPILEHKEHSDKKLETTQKNKTEINTIEDAEKKSNAKTTQKTQ